MKQSHIRIRLTIMNFLQFAIWGAYLTSIGSYLARVGLGDRIWMFFSIQGVASLFMPALMGMIADRFLPAQKAYSLCHGLGAFFMLCAGIYCASSGNPQFGPLFTLYSISIAFYMPSLSLSYSVAYKNLEGTGLNPVSSFPPIRVFGTIGFIATMLLTNFLTGRDGLQFQNSYEQLLFAGCVELALCLYSLTLPECPIIPGTGEKKTFAQASGLVAFKLFKRKEMAIFFLFSALLGAALQITNGYANTFIASFKANPLYQGTWGANNANALISISQISEALCVLLIPLAMRKVGIKGVMLISITAWILRFGLFGLGNPGNGIWMILLSCLVYGVAFDFFNVSGSLYVNTCTDKQIQSSAQGLFVLMTNGIGASVGTWAAGKVVNHFVYDAPVPSWSEAWFCFTAYAALTGILFLIFFKTPSNEVHQ